MNDNNACENRGAQAADTCAIPVMSAAGEPVGATRPRGLSLEFREREFMILVWPAADGEPLAIGPYADEEVIAVWRRLASVSGLPLLLPGPDGVLQHLHPQLGRLLMGERTDRRRLAVLSGRRPRFLAKRRSTVLPRRPRVHREREIVGGRAP